MDIKLYELAANLHESLEEHPDVKLLVEHEEALQKDENIVMLMKEYDTLQLEINTMLESFSIENPRVKEKCGRLFKIKYQLDNEPLVVKYKKQYNVVNKMYRKIADELLDVVGLKRETICQAKEE